MKSWDSISSCAWVIDSGRGPLGIYWWNPGPHPCRARWNPYGVIQNPQGSTRALAARKAHLPKGEGPESFSNDSANGEAMSQPTAASVALSVQYPTDGTCHICRKAIGYWDQRVVNDCTTCELATCSQPSCLSECDYGGGDEGLTLTEWLCTKCNAGRTQ